jgi:hypothetical protein
MSRKEGKREEGMRRRGERDPINRRCLHMKVLSNYKPGIKFLLPSLINYIPSCFTS